MKNVIGINKYNILRVIDTLADIVEREGGLLVSRNPENVPVKKNIIISKSFEDKGVLSYGKQILSFILHDDFYQIVMSDDPFREICFSKSFTPYGVLVEEPIWEHMGPIGKSSFWNNNSQDQNFENLAKGILNYLKETVYSYVEKKEPKNTTLYTKDSELSKIWKEVHNAS